MLAKYIEFNPTEKGRKVV